jgi:hypothetical protein
MKWIGQHIYDLVARFRNDVYLEGLSTTTETNVLVVDSDGKVSKTTVITGDVTGVTAGSNITVTDPTGPVPTVALSTNVDVAGTLDVTGLGTFDASITVDGKISLNDGGNSVFVGEDAGLNDDASANQNVGVGYQALRANTTGSANTANGSVALRSNTTGSVNTAFGSGALYSNTTGGSNIANGSGALYSNTTGDSNIANGHLALYSNTTGGRNTALGALAGAFITNGVTANTVTDNSVFLGYGTKALGNSQTNQIVIGHSAVGLGSNTAILGNSSITTTRLQGGIEINASDTIITRAEAGIIAVEGVNVVTTSSTDTLTNKTLISPKFSSIVNTGTLTLPTSTDTLVGRATTDTLTNKTLTAPIIGDYARFKGSTSGTTTLQATAVAGTTTLTLPAATDTLVGKATTDTLTNKTLTAPTITGAGAIAGVFTGNITGNADTATKIASITNSDIVQLDATQTLTLKTLYRPIIENHAAFLGGTSGTTKLAATEVAGTTTLTLPAATDTLVGRATSDTLSNKTLAEPRIASTGATFAGSTSGGTRLQATAVAGTTTLTLPAATDTLVGTNTIDTLTNKTLTSPTLTTPILGTPQSGDLTNCTFPTLNQSTTGNADTATKIASITNTDIVQLDASQTLTSKTLTAPTITGAGAIAGVFTGNITGNVTGNADTVTTNANLTGPVTSTGNATAIANGAITTAMQKHLQTFEFNGYSAAPASTNYFIPALISVQTGPFNHNVDAGADGLASLAPSVLSRSGGKVMPYAGTCKLWKGWVGVNGTAAFNISIFKYTPVPDDATPDSLVEVKNFSDTALGNISKLIAISVDDITVGFDAGDILITGISCESGKTVFFTSTLEVEWD